MNFYKFREKIQAHHIKSKSIEISKIVFVQNAFTECFSGVTEVCKDEKVLERLSTKLDGLYLKTVHDVLGTEYEEETKIESAPKTGMCVSPIKKRGSRKKKGQAPAVQNG